MPTADALLRSRVFDGLTDAERERWLAGERSPTSLADTRWLVRATRRAAFYVLESGFLKLLQLTAEGTELIVRFVVPGEPFGGVVALSDAPYPVTAVAVQPSVVRTWSREAVADLLGDTPQVRVNIMREMATHMTDAADACARADDGPRRRASRPYPAAPGAAMRPPDP